MSSKQKVQQGVKVPLNMNQFNKYLLNKATMNHKILISTCSIQCL